LVDGQRGHDQCATDDNDEVRHCESDQFSGKSASDRRDDAIRRAKQMADELPKLN
jgi:hypothetical protein